MRFCNSLVGADNQNLPVSITVGSHRLSADSRGCAPAAGTACVEVPSGPLKIMGKIGSGAEGEIASVDLKPGTSYLLRTSLFEIEKDKQLPLLPYIELENAADCDGLDYEKSRRRTEAPLELEPFKGEGWSFAKPRGFARTGGGPGSHVFEPSNPADAVVSRFQITYLGRLPENQAPSAEALVKQALAARKLTLVGKIEVSADYAAATGDSGVDGPGRFVRLMFLRHWELGDESLSIFSSLTGNRPKQVDLFTAEFAFPIAPVEPILHLAYVLKSIAWGVAIPVDEVPADQRTGTWESISGGIGSTYVDSRGNYAGSFTPGSMFRITFGPDGTYDLLTVYSVRCSGSAICIIEGIATATTHGRYRMEGGVMTLSPLQCEYKFYDTNVQLKNSSGCDLASSPIAMRVGRGQDGRLFMSGLGGDVIKPEAQRIWSPARKDGAKAPWNVTEMDRAAMPAPAGAGGVAICGPVLEKEPNDAREQAIPYTVGQDAVGCAPTPRDPDYWELSSPPGGASGGFFVGTLTPSELGKVEAVVESVEDNREIVRYVYATEAGAPVHFYWSAVPGQKYRVLTRAFSGGGDWYRYTLNIAYTPVTDAQEPNDTAAEAKPITLGAPVTGTFFAGHKASMIMPGQSDDWFAVTLQPGMVTIKVDDVAPDITASLSLQDPQNASVYHQSLNNYMMGANLNAVVPVTAAGTHKIRLSHRSQWASAGKGENRMDIPESFTRPYRITVTQ